MNVIISEADFSEGDDEGAPADDNMARGYSVAETILVPPTAYKKLQPRDSRLTTLSNRSARKLASKLASTDPKDIVRKFWQDSFSQSRKSRKMTQTRSKIRRSILLAEELRKLEKEDVLWKEEYADPAGMIKRKDSYIGKDA